MRRSKYLKYLVAVIIFTTVVGYNKNLFSWGLFDLFSDTEFTREGLAKVKKFNPDRDILYLPMLEDKELFESISDLSICRKKSVRKYIYLYLTSGREYLKRSILNSYEYKDIVEEIVKQNPDIPEDIALLPLLESGFNPKAVSRSKAVGMWQIMKNTSDPLGLKRNRWVDERRDVEKSTRAALQHLINLNKRFNSWELTLAAYNGGGGHVGRAVKKTGAKNIWDLIDSGTLRKETEQYVPRYIALVLIYKNQRLFDIKGEVEKNKILATEKIILKSAVNIKHVSTISGVSLKTLKRLNPELKKNITPPYSKEYSLRIPVEAKEKLQKQEKKLYRFRYTYIKKHRVKKGECVSRIAQRYKKKLVLSSSLTT